MKRLHLKLYLAIVGTLLVFLVMGVVTWHHFTTPREGFMGIESATDLAASVLATTDSTGRAAGVVEALSRQLRADVALYDTVENRVVHASGHVPRLDPEQWRRDGWTMSRDGPTLIHPVSAGRCLAVQPHRRIFLMGVHISFVFLIGIAGMLALLTYPIARGITARLERLQAGVTQLGAGNLAARVRVEGKDEVAALARSFNEAAGRVEQLVKSHKLLLANCSHELRTPLARIRLAVEPLAGADSPTGAELRRSIQELDALIGEMLLSSRLDAASGVEHVEPVDLLALLAEEAAHFDREAGGAPLTIVADPVLLRRLVRNLLENARVHAGGATDVRLEAGASEARIVVEDRGAGVPEADRERIFEPFYRAGAATAASGAGLGLAIVRQIARAHRGRVECLARDGGGSRFVVTLPLGD